MKTLKAVLILLVLAVSVAAMPTSVQDTLSDFGILGTWAPDCTIPPGSDTNQYAQYTSSSPSEATLRYYYGPNSKYSDRIYNIYFAMRIDADHIRTDARVHNSDEESIETITLKQGNGIRVMSTIRMDGTVYTKDGIMLLSGKPSPWLYSCK